MASPRPTVFGLYKLSRIPKLWLLGPFVSTERINLPGVGRLQWVDIPAMLSSSLCSLERECGLWFPVCFFDESAGTLEQLIIFILLVGEIKEDLSQSFSNLMAPWNCMEGVTKNINAWLYADISHLIVRGEAQAAVLFLRLSTQF
jgi:hypothetical protein